MMDEEEGEGGGRMDVLIGGGGSVAVPRPRLRRSAEKNRRDCGYYSIRKKDRMDIYGRIRERYIYVHYTAALMRALTLRLTKCYHGLRIHSACPECLSILGSALIIVAELYNHRISN